MIGYVMLGTKDLKAATAFYDTVLSPLGVHHVMEKENYFVAWGRSMEEPSLSIVLPYNGEPATAGNGTMIALYSPNRETVDKVYALAMEAGGTCEGKPGIREDYSPDFYVAYFRDLDGNKLDIFCPIPV